MLLNIEMEGEVADLGGSPIWPRWPELTTCLLLYHWNKYVKPLLDDYEFAYLQRIY